MKWAHQLYFFKLWGKEHPYKPYIPIIVCAGWDDRFNSD